MTQNSVDADALRWLAQRLRWERLLADIHAGRIPPPPAEMADHDDLRPLAA
jgi:hypothetical protein